MPMRTTGTLARLFAYISGLGKKDKKNKKDKA